MSPPDINHSTEKDPLSETICLTIKRTSTPSRNLGRSARRRKAKKCCTHQKSDLTKIDEYENHDRSRTVPGVLIRRAECSEAKFNSSDCNELTKQLGVFCLLRFIPQNKINSSS